MVKYISRKQKMKNCLKHNYSLEELTGKSAKSDKIVDYLDLCTNFELHVAKYRNTWKVTLEETLVFYRLDISDHPVIKASIKIDKNLKVEIFTQQGRVNLKSPKLPSLSSQFTLQYWFQLKKMLQDFGTEEMNGHISIKYGLRQSLKYLRGCQDNVSLEENISFKAKLEFLSSQIYALLSNTYTSSMLFLAYIIYLRSSSSYRYLQNLDFFILPPEDDLVRLAACDTDSTDDKKIKPKQEN